MQTFQEEEDEIMDDEIEKENNDHQILYIQMSVLKTMTTKICQFCKKECGFDVKYDGIVPTVLLTCGNIGCNDYKVEYSLLKGDPRYYNNRFCLSILGCGSSHSHIDKFMKFNIIS